MVFCVLVLILGFFCLLLSRDIKLNITKDESFKIRITVFNLNFTFKNKKKRKKHLPYSFLLVKATDLLKKCEITITKLDIPKSEENFSVDTFLAPIKRHALLSLIISFIETKAKSLEVKENAIPVFSGVSHICLDITLKFKLFYLLKFLFAYIMLSLREQKRNRRKAYVRE